MRVGEWMSRGVSSSDTDCKMKEGTADWSPFLCHTRRHCNTHLLKLLPWTAGTWTHTHSHTHYLGHSASDHSPHMEKTYTYSHLPEESQHGVWEWWMTKAGKKGSQSPLVKRNESTWLVLCCLHRKLNYGLFSVLTLKHDLVESLGGKYRWGMSWKDLFCSPPYPQLTPLHPLAWVNYW